MNTVPPQIRIELIERSIRCFTFALWGLVPVIGILMVVRAMIESWKIKALQGGNWNPGDRLRKWAGAVAVVGCLLSFAQIVVIGILIYKPWQP